MRWGKKWKIHKWGEEILEGPDLEYQKPQDYYLVDDCNEQRKVWRKILKEALTGHGEKKTSPLKFQ